MTSVIAKIIISIMAFLFILFPNNGSLQYNHLIQTNGTNIVAPKIVEAIKERDIDTLEEMMCLNIKQNTENLPEKIGELLDAIDGEIIEITYKLTGTNYSSSRPEGSMVQDSMKFYIKTSTSEGTYRLSVVWEIANTFAIEETGIRGTGLTDPDGYFLTNILATEGVGCWHD